MQPNILMFLMQPNILMFLMQPNILMFRGDAGVVGSAQLADLGESGAVSQQVVGSNPDPPEKVLPKGRKVWA